MSLLAVTTDELQGLIERIERLYPDTLATNDLRYIARSVGAQQAANMVAEFLIRKLFDKLDVELDILKGEK